MRFKEAWGWLSPYRWRRWHWIVLSLAGVFFLLLVLLPRFLRREIADQLAGTVAAEVRLADVDFNPFRGRLALQGLTLTLKGEEQPVLTIQRLVGNLRVLSLLSGRVSLEEVQLSGLRVAAVQQENGTLNLSRLFPPPPPSETPPPESDLPTLTIERLDLSAAEVAYLDRTRTPPARLTLALKDLSIGEIALQAQGLAAPTTGRLAGTFNEEPLQGQAQIFWQRTQTTIEAEIEVQQLALTIIEPYLRDALTLQRLSGHADARMRYRYSNGGNLPPLHIVEGILKLERVSFADPLSGQTAVDLRSGQVTIEKIDFLNHEIRLTTMEFTAPQLSFLQTPTGLNWSALVRTPNNSGSSETSQPTASPAWRFFLQEARLTGGAIIYRDSAWAESETITFVPEEVQVQRISNGNEDWPLRFRLRVGEGTLAGEGSVRLAPFHLQTQSQLTGIDLTNLRPLLTHALAAESVRGTVNGTIKADLTLRDDTPVATVSGAVETVAFAVTGIPQAGNALTWESARLELNEGSSLVPLDVAVNAQLSRISLQHLPLGDVSIEKVEGNLRFAQEEGTSLHGTPNTGQRPIIKTHGTLDVSSFLLTHGPEKQEILSCYQVRAALNEGSRLFPLDLRLGDVALEYPYAQGFRTTTGQFQLFSPSSGSVSSPVPTSVASPDPSPATPPAQDSAPGDGFSPTVHLDRVTLIGGQLYFEDHAVSPPQTIYWQNLRVDVGDVGYPLSRPASFSLHAFNLDGAPIEVKGTTQRQGDQLLTRVHGKIERLSLPRFNVYFASLLGYRVRNGSVSLTWDLLIPGDRLQAATAVTLHDIGLSGEQSPSALEEQVGLPLTLVIALLKDLNGNINLNLPVEGRFNDPTFQLGGTIFRAVRDVLIGAVTSPLKLLGAVLKGGGKEKIENFVLEPIRFVPGTKQLSVAGTGQIARLSRFLAQRPELDLHLSGHTGPEDLLALQDSLILAQLQEQTQPAEAQNSDEVTQGGTAPQVTPQEEVRQFLAYQLDQVKEGGTPVLSVPAVALLTQLREQTTVSPQAVEQLMQERVQTVITALTANSAIVASRLQLSPEKRRGRESAEVRYLLQAKGGQ